METHTIQDLLLDQQKGDHSQQQQQPDVSPQLTNTLAPQGHAHALPVGAKTSTHSGGQTETTKPPSANLTTQTGIQPTPDNPKSSTEPNTDNPHPLPTHPPTPSDNTNKPEQPISTKSTDTSPTHAHTNANTHTETSQPNVNGNDTTLASAIAAAAAAVTGTSTVKDTRKWTFELGVPKDTVKETTKATRKPKSEPPKDMQLLTSVFSFKSAPRRGHPPVHPLSLGYAYPRPPAVHKFTLSQQLPPHPPPPPARPFAHGNTPLVQPKTEGGDETNTPTPVAYRPLMTYVPLIPYPATVEATLNSTPLTTEPDMASVKRKGLTKRPYMVKLDKDAGRNEASKEGEGNEGEEEEGASEGNEVEEEGGENEGNEGEEGRRVGELTRGMSSFYEELISEGAQRGNGHSAASELGLVGWLPADIPRGGTRKRRREDETEDESEEEEWIFGPYSGPWKDDLKKPEKEKEREKEEKKKEKKVYKPRKVKVLDEAAIEALKEKRRKYKENGQKRKKENGKDLCEHNKQRSGCRHCRPLCPHGRIINSTKLCTNCHPEVLCEHGNRRDYCRQCGGKWIRMCEHNKRRERCIDCHPEKFCPHKRRPYQCKDCGGARFCVHNKQKQTCRLCGGNIFCPHGKHKNKCVDCNPEGWFQKHYRPTRQGEKYEERRRKEMERLEAERLRKLANGGFTSEDSSVVASMEEGSGTGTRGGKGGKDGGDGVVETPTKRVTRGSARAAAAAAAASGTNTTTTTTKPPRKERTEPILPPHHFQMLAKYNAWANVRLYESASQIPDAWFRDDIMGGLRALLGVFLRGVMADNMWLEQFPRGGEENGEVDAIDVAELQGGGLKEIMTARVNLDQSITNFTNTLTQESLREKISFSSVDANKNSEIFEYDLDVALTHFFSQHAHQRGQAHGLMALLGCDVPVSGLVDFLQSDEGRACNPS